MALSQLDNNTALEPARRRGPVLRPWLTILTRSTGQVQLGWDPERALLITPPAGADAAAIRTVLSLLDGRNPQSRIVTIADEWGIAPADTFALLAELDAAGLLVGSSAKPLVRAIRVHGRGPLSDAIATALRPGSARVRRSVSYGPDDDAARWRADLVVLADDLVPDPRLVADLIRLRIAHLPVRLRDGRSVVGPLVLPGRTSCLRCADLIRAETDPEWPHLAAQLYGRVGHATPSAVQATTSLALHEIETILAGSSRIAPTCLDATLELDLDSHRLGTRRWYRHRLCDCSTVAER